MNTLITHVHIFTPECTLIRMLPSLNIKPQVFSWKNTLAPLKPAAQIIFSPSECGLSAINLYLTAAQLCERDFSAVGTFLALSIFAEKGSLFTLLTDSTKKLNHITDFTHCADWTGFSVWHLWRPLM